jgi:para-aminobenzoate synthetase/4-amino-4-deoxychorismate lyase
MAEYGTGGGVVWDSTAASEYEECFTKASVLTNAAYDFALFETLRYDPGQGFFCFEEHMERISYSVRYWGFALDLEKMQHILFEDVAHARVPQRVRLTVQRDGGMTVQSEDLLALPDQPVGVAPRGSCQKNDVLLYHKTTYRVGYKKALDMFPACFDVILVNEDGDCTESCLGNVVYALGGVLYTPPVSCGLLNGTFRRKLLRSGDLQERRLQREDLMTCEKIWIINSVREWIPVAMQDLRFAEET